MGGQGFIPIRKGDSLIYTSPDQQPDRSFRRLWLSLSIIGSILLLNCVVYIILHVLTPPLDATATANAYYQAIENKDFTKAYSYLSPDYPVGGHERLSQAMFISSARAKDTTAGPVTNFSQIGNSTNNGIVSVSLAITRTGQSYIVNLLLQQNHSVWQIINADDL